MTDNQAKILVALRRTGVALTSTALATKVNLKVNKAEENCQSLVAAGLIDCSGGSYRLSKGKRNVFN